MLGLAQFVSHPSKPRIHSIPKKGVTKGFGVELECGYPPAMKSIFVIHYGELALKGGNRSWFENRLVRNIRRALESFEGVRVDRIYGRILLDPGPCAHQMSAIEEQLSRVFGIAWFGRALIGDLSWPVLCDLTMAALPDEGNPTFGVRTKKADSEWARGRTETSRDLGAFIVEKKGWKVNLTNPDIWVRVEVASGRVLVATEKIAGLKGLPVGVSGKALTLLSGGIDSPVASFRMMSRGCRLTGAHFHSAPFTNQASQDKVVELASILARHQGIFPLFMIPFAECQRAIVTETPQRFRVILYRRFMMRIAEALARREGAEALVTGESLGQVASQTIPNLTTVQRVASLPILRPLIGMDKDEISDVGRAMGSFEISIQPHDDCCSYLMPRRPATHSRPDELEEVEQSLDVNGLVHETLENIELLTVRP